MYVCMFVCMLVNVRQLTSYGEKNVREEELRGYHLPS